MIQSLLANIRREDLGQIANELMNNYCVLKYDSRYDGDVIFRFAEIEFYLYDASEQEVDMKTYSRDCLCGEWFFLSRGVDFAFETVRKGDELIRFGGILLRSVEMYRLGDDGQWVLMGVVGGPKLSMYEIFNHTSRMPEIVKIPAGFKTDRQIGEPTMRIGLGDDLLQRYVLTDVNWEMPTERVVELKDGDVYRVKVATVAKKYNPKY